MSDSTEVRWVPQNLSQFQDVLHLKKGRRNGEKPSIYGLPIFDLYYTLPGHDNLKIPNRLFAADGTPHGHNMLHAFRILVGTTWNWYMSNIAGYKLSEDDLNHTITSLCRQCAGIKKDDPKPWQWHKLLNVKNNDPSFLQIVQWRNDIIQLSRTDTKPYKNSLKWFIDNIGFFGIEKEAKITLVPIAIQKAYINVYAEGNVTDAVKKKAIKLFIKDFQKEFTAAYVTTKDQHVWSLDYDEETIRKSSFMLSKTAQRTLSLTNRNSKKKHGRTHAVNSHP